MPQISAGILLYRQLPDGPEILLIHPGGPFWARKDAGAWSIPKGLVDPDEDHELAARREFLEETGFAPAGQLQSLGAFKQPGGKTIVAYALEGEFDPATLRSNTFALEWPPRSGRLQDFPEADRAGWFGADEARRKLLKGQLPILEALLEKLRRA